MTEARPIEGDDLTTRVVNMVRHGYASTRPDLRRVGGLGRTVVDERVAQAIAAGVLTDDDYVPSNGGRPSRRLRFRAEAGTIHAIDVGTHHLAVAVSNLDGEILASATRDRSMAEAPVQTLSAASELLAALATQTGTSATPWAVTMGLPGPVDFVAGRALSGDLAMTGWERFDLPGWFAEQGSAPFWVDNDLNLLVDLVVGPAPDIDHENTILVKISNGLGAGIISRGQVHRGRHGAAGDIGHAPVGSVVDKPTICRCGRYNCLEAFAAGWGLTRDALAAAQTGESPFLAERLASSGTIVLDDIFVGARHNDAFCFSLIERSATLVGDALADYVAFFDPGLICLTGLLPAFGDVYQAIVRRVILQRTLPLLTHDLRIEQVVGHDDDGLRGAVRLGVERLFAPEGEQLWLSRLSATT